MPGSGEGDTPLWKTSLEFPNGEGEQPTSSQQVRSAHCLSFADLRYAPFASQASKFMDLYLGGSEVPEIRQPGTFSLDPLSVHSQLLGILSTSSTEIRYCSGLGHDGEEADKVCAMAQS